MAVQLDTVYVDMAALQQERCPASAPLAVVTVPGNPIGELAAKRVNTVINDYPIAVADVAKTPDVEISGRQIEPLPYGIGFARDNRQLMLAFQEAFYLLVQDGTYDKVLEKWKLTEGPCGPVSSTAACDGPQGNPAAQWMCEPPLTS